MYGFIVVSVHTVGPPSLLWTISLTIGELILRITCYCFVIAFLIRQCRRGARGVLCFDRGRIMSLFTVNYLFLRVAANSLHVLDDLLVYWRIIHIPIFTAKIFV